MAVTIFKLSNKEIRNIIIKSKNTPICSIGFCKRKFGIDVERYFGNAIRACKETRLVRYKGPVIFRVKKKQSL